MKKHTTPYYAGNEFADLNYQDGGLKHIVGASNYQLMRANRAHPEWSDGLGYTYNHAPAITYWRSKFYVQYLTNPVDEHTGSGVSLLCTSENAVDWSKPEIIFPALRVPAGVYTCSDGEEILVTEEKDAFMHQRMVFFHSSDDRLLATGFYGHAPAAPVCPWGKYGMGRAVREIYEDGTFGEMYFIRPMTESGWTEERLPRPLYSKCEDKGFVKACEELLQDRLVTQQWAEEHGVEDPLVHLKAVSEKNSSLEAFCWYHIDEETIVALWKHGYTALSTDGGETYTICKEPTFATSGGKAWGQKTQDGKFAIAYLNSICSEHRYPMVVVTSEDGIRFDDMGVAFGEVPPRRYDGLWKDFGPQYLRGICEGHQEYPDNAFYITHSVNKEDIWVTRVPVPVQREVTGDVNDTFTMDTPYFDGWNIYSSVWAPIRKHLLPDGRCAMRIADKDPVDYARAERIFESGSKVTVEFDLLNAEWRYDQPLYMELTDEQGHIATRLALSTNGLFGNATCEPVLLWNDIKAVAWLKFKMEYDCKTSLWTVYLNGEQLNEKPIRGLHRVNEVSRLVFRTKPYRMAPGMERRPETADLPNSDEPSATERIYYIDGVNIHSEK